jgi:hypothetical protein
MKLSQLIPHTSDFLGIPGSQVKTVARVLQPAGLISLGGRGPGSADMTVDDKINLLLGVCGVEVANRAAEHVRVWRRLIRMSKTPAHEFAFLQSETVRDFFFDLITKDLNGGGLDVWLAAGYGHEITLDFYVDEFEFKIVVSRISPSADAAGGHSAEVIKVHFMQPPPYDPPFEQPRKDAGYRAPSKLIRRLDARNLRGWGTCLTEPGAT